MRKVARWKIVLLIVVLGLAGWSLYPTFRLVALSEEDRAGMDPEALARLEDGAIHLGLDLKGGMHLVLEVDKSDLSEDEARDAVDRAMEIISNRIDQFGVREPSIQRGGGDRIIIELPGLTDEGRAKKLIGQTALLEFQLVQSLDLFRDLLFKIDKVAKGLDLEALVLEDAAAPDTTQLAEVESEQDESPEAAADTLETGEIAPPVASSLVHFVPMGGGSERALVMEGDVRQLRAVLANRKVGTVIPDDLEFLWASEFETGAEGRFKELFLVSEDPELTGNAVSNAIPTANPRDPTHLQVTLEMTRRGSAKFTRVTGANIGRQLAIVLDNKVFSAPVIRTRIPGDAVIQGSFTDAEARDLAIVLRAGKLPAPLRFLEERTVGPSLGSDSIRKGVQSVLIGGLAVLLFMVAYYKASGIIADMALTLNLILILGAMAMLGATLTLPGIAGIVLVVGLAVDANVLIFERIREELKLNKPIRAAIERGYSRAFITIVDANVTTLITAMVLLYFGTATVKGFAVTLSIGLLASMFTAILVTRMVFDAITNRYELKSLSI
ncbi:MAG: protein translocase subunit SecD [Candidatus Eisenbacteria sp.]|nr:protein translocase subunit SecD [Candidatus Eisenbacteria bacterium]